jgi:probable HAF family extracellular repeat protein
MKRDTRCVVLLVVMTLCLASPGLAQTTYALTNLVGLGGTLGVGLSVNSTGQVTGYAYLADGITSHAFLYTPGAGTVDLNTLASGSGWTLSVGFGINDAGQITGYGTNSNGESHAFLYSGGAVTDLGTAGSQSYGYAINNSAQVTGSQSLPGFFGRAFLYSGGSTTDLGIPGVGSVGSAINASGQIAGWANTSFSVFRAFLYSGGVTTDLGTLGGSRSAGLGINASGQVTGYSYTTGDATYHAFLYSGGSMADLGTLGGTFSDGLGINASGQVTGYSFSNNGEVAFLYTPSAGMVDLNTLIPSGSGWTLLAAYGINDAGQITGYGTIPNGNGAAEPFLLVPVVPFSAFTAELEISGNPLSSFEINGSFTLGAGSHGIDPVNEPVTLALDTFSITIPKKSFTRTSTGAFQYEGSVQGVPLEFRIRPVTNGFTFTAEGNRATGLPATKLVTITLTIGDDMGTKTVRRGS